MVTIDYSTLEHRDALAVAAALDRRENFCGYIPSQAFDFILLNASALRQQGALEEAWLDAYLNQSHFADHGFDVVKAVFDMCDRSRLRAGKANDDPVAIARSGRVSLFRGCAGPVHHMGMSWTASLDKAIWYAAHKAAYYDQTNLAVYTATVAIEEVYCRLDRNEEEFIVAPSAWWKVEVPESEFRLDRPR
tara:strand:+ start:1876 stop:2448 length:573 start_codon:yes stop_codon:yes gene_type:complete